MPSDACSLRRPGFFERCAAIAPLPYTQAILHGFFSLRRHREAHAAPPAGGRRRPRGGTEAESEPRRGERFEVVIDGNLVRGAKRQGPQGRCLLWSAVAAEKAPWQGGSPA